ncbi:hypothetical protein ET445_04280 [Agromyces protaetiae]|uniref:Uncharacterized protein n=1 Tax=Agromyces protaetiae TaxID=2509455 RepID=A0A4V0YGX0_9MICO|nr:hypothetical protein [Agromyces protaetiae]QAY72681.1 hypothetical protein ET445_04280 [Agromyces protaetiae]
MHDDQHLATGSPGAQAASRAETARRYLRMLDALADEVGAIAPALPPAAGRLDWRSAASATYDTQLDSLRGALAQGAREIDCARAELRASISTMSTEPTAWSPFGQ